NSIGYQRRSYPPSVISLLNMDAPLSITGTFNERSTALQRTSQLSPEVRSSVVGSQPAVSYAVSARHSSSLHPNRISKRISAHQPLPRISTALPQAPLPPQSSHHFQEQGAPPAAPGWGARFGWMVGGLGVGALIVAIVLVIVMPGTTPPNSDPSTGAVLDNPPPSSTPSAPEVKDTPPEQVEGAAAAPPAEQDPVQNPEHPLDTEQAAEAQPEAPKEPEVTPTVTRQTKKALKKPVNAKKQKAQTAAQRQAGSAKSQAKPPKDSHTVQVVDPPPAEKTQPAHGAEASKAEKVTPQENAASTKETAPPPATAQDTAGAKAPQVPVLSTQTSEPAHRKEPTPPTNPPANSAQSRPYAPSKPAKPAKPSSDPPPEKTKRDVPFGF
ncbi:MAG: hypothetical protein AAFX99_31900, partial [Myxococcota bacterium]